MKVLILTVAVGGGHTSVSKALACEIGDRAEVMVYDLFKKKKKERSKFVNEFYFFTCKHLMPVSNAFYRWIFNRNVNRKKATFFHFLTRKAKPRVQSLINEYKPDVVFCAHTYCAHVMSDLRDKGLVDPSIKVFSAVTDYEVSSYTEVATNIDYIVSPCDWLDAELIRRGMKKEQILHFGIPTNSIFQEEIDKSVAREKLGILDKPTVMIMNGEVGLGNPLKIIRDLSDSQKDFQIIVVCGKNEKLKEKLDKAVESGKFQKQVYVHGYVDNVDVLMSATDLIIGKVGGLSVSEAFNKRVPMIAVRKLPWQEYDNMMHLCREGAIDYMADEGQARELVEKCLFDTVLREKRLKNIDRIRKPNATKDIVEMMFSSVENGK